MHLCNSRQATAAPILFACRNSPSRSSLQQGGSVRDRIVFAIAGFLWLPQVSSAAGVAGPVTEVTHAPIIEHGPALSRLVSRVSGSLWWASGAAWPGMDGNGAWQEPAPSPLRQVQALARRQNLGCWREGAGALGCTL